MSDPVLRGFLTQQFEEGTALARASDLIELTPVAGMPPSRYIARFRCTGLVRQEDGAVQEHDDFAVGIWFPADYLRRAEPFQTLTWLGPANVFHPNIGEQSPVICVGKLTPGTGLVDLLYQCFEIITYRKVTMREDDALNKEACRWARENQDRFPVDSRPLKRRSLNFVINTHHRG